MMDPRIDGSITTCSGTPRTLATPLVKEFIKNTARRSVQVLWTPRHVSWTGRDSTTPGDTPHAVRSPWDNSPVMNDGIGVYPTSGHSGSLQVFNKRKSTVSEKLGIPKNWTLPLIESD